MSEPLGSTSPTVKSASGAHRDGHQGRAQKFVANIGYGGGRALVFAANTLVLVPVLMSLLGKEQFALLALVGPFLRYGFNGIFDIGIASGAVRYISREWGGRATENVNGYVSSCLVIYALVGVLLAVLYGSLRQWFIPFLLRSGSPVHADAHLVFCAALGIYFVFLLSNPFFALLMGVQRVHLTHVIGTVSLVIELVGVLVLIPFGLSLPRVLCVYAFEAMASLILCLWLARRSFPDLRVRIRFVSLQKVADLLGYGGKFSVTVVASMLSPILDKLILARFVGLWGVAWYEAAARLAELLRRATQLFLLPVFPMAGAMGQNQPASQRHEFYARIFSVNQLLSVGLYLIPATLAVEIFRVWLGPDSWPGALAFMVLAGTYFALALVGPLSMILAGTGRMRLLLVTGLAGLLMNLTLSPLLAWRYGFVGMLAGTAIAYGLLNLFYLAYTLRIPEFAVSPWWILRSTVFLSAAAILPAILVTWLLQHGHGEPGVAKLIASGLVTGGVYGAVLLARSENRAILVRAFDELKRLLFSRGVQRGEGEPSVFA